MKGLQNDAAGVEHQKDYEAWMGHVLAVLGKMLKALMDEILPAPRPGEPAVKHGS